MHGLAHHGGAQPAFMGCDMLHPAAAIARQFNQSPISAQAHQPPIIATGNRAILAIGSTLGPDPVQHIAHALAAKNVEVLDIPISGGIIAAREGRLSLMAGGTVETLARAHAVLAVFANQITRTGSAGTGQAAKLAHQLVFGLNVMALLEGLALGVAGGVDPAVMKEVLKQGLANSTVLQVWHDLGPRWKGMLEATPPGAPLPNLRKDLHAVLELARELGVTLPIGTEVSRVADIGTASGHDDPRL